MKLYHYVHCPFCVRVRMALGLFGLSYNSVVLSYDDETTPVQLTGKKMLPIFENDQGKVMNESLDIIRQLDKQKILNWDLYNLEQSSVENILNLIGSDVHSLCMPYWIWTPEFNDQSRRYFQSKKELKRGPFKQLIHDKEKYIKSLQQTIAQHVTPELRPYYKSDKLTIIDIMLASHLWGMYIFPEFQFGPDVHAYLKRVKKDCHFDYHKDFWL